VANTEKIVVNILIGWDALLHNKIRALLTSLGIIFGVSAVIAMLAIGAGAEKEILDQMKLVGSNNIIIKPIVESAEKQKNDPKGLEKKKYSPGLSINDVENIKSVVPNIGLVSPEVALSTNFIRAGIKKAGRVVGIQNSYFKVANVRISNGKAFTATQELNGAAVCIIGRRIKAQFFPKSEAIGERIKCGNVWLTVIGVLESGNVSTAAVDKLSIRDFNDDVYIPIKTFLLRFENKAALTPAKMKQSFRYYDDDEDGQNKKQPINHHTLDRVVINVTATEHIGAAKEIIQKILRRRHNEVADYEIIVPELLLKQEQKTKQLFNTVLGIIASISLIVGGIGIMNIMLASVLERTKEIGLRLAIGAQKKDIVMQFMSEAVAISFSGGIIGILLGLTVAIAIEKLADIQTVITPFSVILSFGVAISIGLLFGIWPAKRASEQNPIESLRYE
jgi:putative ABC transport system permease protein